MPYTNFPGDWPGWRISATVRPAYIDADLSDYTLYIDELYNPILRSPNNFLNLDGPRPARADGADLRLTEDIDGNIPVPFDLIEYIPAADETDLENAHVLFSCKRSTVSSTLPSTVWIWWGNPTATAIPRTDPNGRNETYLPQRQLYSHLGGALTAGDDRTVNNRVQNAGASELFFVEEPPVQLLGRLATRVQEDGNIEIAAGDEPSIEGALTITFAHYFVTGSG
ncbi:MAG: hypothetical protein LC650_01450, partial [Actinobacteria bacterium]|nr:hypothetical protein [Actinomycetota bacterium]